MVGNIGCGGASDQRAKVKRISLQMNEFDQLFELADQHKEGELDFEDLKSLFTKINFYPNQLHLHTQFSAIAKNKSKINKEEFKSLVAQFRQKPFFIELYKQLCKAKSASKWTDSTFTNLYNQITERIQHLWYHDDEPDSNLEKAQFCDFLEVQGESEAFISDFLQKHAIGTHVPYSVFLEYFENDENRLYSHDHRSRALDGSKPIQEHFINSSHNSYLMGNQLTSHSSTKSYENVLSKGARCVELDCWDGKNGPIIKHGFTLTTEITFESAIETISSHAFLNSDFPLILSLEIHCGVQGQQKMIGIMKSVFGEQLAKYNETATLDELKGKILLQAKAIEKDEITQKDEKHYGISKELSEFVYQIVKPSKHTADFTNVLPHELVNISEGNIKHILEKHPDQVLQASKRSCIRVYPEGTRVNSSNLNPLKYWQFQIQMPSLNFQNFDSHLQINRGFYRQFQNCGYVPKQVRSCKKTVKVQVLQGYRIPHHFDNSLVVDPYVCVELITPTKDRHLVHHEKYETEKVSHNGFNPVFQNFEAVETLKFSTVVESDLSFIQFSVRDKREFKELLCESVVPVHCLCSGYRVVSMFDLHGDRLDWTYLVVNVKVTDLE
ncbi:1-phosphatidylinositol 4,5-bisphosphate phosphodiesterase delta-4 [Terramyces sp. JEL0728]|nr:1-phosphatidylinositol 4,5-bisphosphate phosphodiesterase delta-4 [Terramyces sp. JEL0728]